MVTDELATIDNHFASREFRTYFKYCSDEPRVIKGIFEQEKIRFTQPRALNDPLESAPILRFRATVSPYRSYELEGSLLPSIELFYRVQVIESRINAYGILSLTKIPNSFDMWSRYANGHKGFLIEFKDGFQQCACMKSKDCSQYPVKKVEYVEEHTITLDDLADENRDIPVETLHNIMFYTKTSRWESEEEYRMVRPLTDSPDYIGPISKYSHIDDRIYLFDFHWDCVDSVTLGAQMTRENKKFIADCCKRHGIPLFQAFIIQDRKDRFGKPGYIYLTAYDSFERPETVLDAPLQVFCTNTTKLNSAESVVRISKLSDLPYYAGWEEVVEQLWENAADQR